MNVGSALRVGGLAAIVGAMMTGGLGAAGPSDNGAMDAMQQFLRQGPPLVRSYEATRVLRATAGDGRMEATIEAVVTFDAGRFDYRIVRESGSPILRKYVLVRALEEEQRTINEGRTADAALTPANYRFAPAGVDPQGPVRIAITPHRPAVMLLDGELQLTASGELLGVLGHLSQAPSFWTQHVEIERRYTTVEGFRVPGSMRSTAQVRVVGTGTFDMRYSYSRINGRTVGGGSRDEPVAPIRRGPHIIPASVVGSGEFVRKLS